MGLESYVLLVLSAFAILFSVGVLLTKDNFYSALFMSFALLTIGTIYALADLQPVFVLIAFIFVGAVGMVTVALAAVYKFKPSTQLSKYWVIPSTITAIILSYTLYTFAGVGADIKAIEIGNFTSEYLILIVFLISLMVLLMLAVIGIARRGET
jgi:NADH-quinone oxidoreductase subunit J